MSPGVHWSSRTQLVSIRWAWNGAQQTKNVTTTATADGGGGDVEEGTGDGTNRITRQRRWQRSKAAKTTAARRNQLTSAPLMTPTKNRDLQIRQKKSSKGISYRSGVSSPVLQYAQLQLYNRGYDASAMNQRLKHCRASWLDRTFTLSSARQTFYDCCAWGLKEKKREANKGAFESKLKCETKLIGLSIRMAYMT